VDKVEGILQQILDILQGGNRQLDQHDDRPPHDNHGRPPRNDDSDDDDDYDDDFHHPPGARIRRTVTPHAGPLLPPDHLDIARPGLNDVRPIVDVGPEGTRDLPSPPGPANVLAGGDPTPVEHIGAFIRALPTSNYIGEVPAPAPPTPATAFANPDPDYVPTFDELKLAMEALKEQYDEYTTSEFSFSVTIETDLEADD
jgi:hypothetical protein